jgi:hypothetical protein
METTVTTTSDFETLVAQLEMAAFEDDMDDLDTARSALLDAIREATRPTQVYEVVFAGDGDIGDLFGSAYLDEASANARRDELLIDDRNAEWGEWKTGEPTVTATPISYREDAPQ